MELSPYTGIIFLFLAAGGFLIFMLAISYLLGPKHKTTTKQLPFECGSVSVGDVNSSRFSVRFYQLAVIFILFDVEVIFMYPWAVNILKLSWPGFVAMMSFVFVLTLGLIYVWKKGVFNWND